MRNSGRLLASATTAFHLISGSLAYKASAYIPPLQLSTLLSRQLLFFDGILTMATSPAQARRRDPRNLQYALNGEQTPQTRITKRRRVVTPGSVTEEKTNVAVNVDQKGHTKDTHFEDLRVPPNELRPSKTLTTGQCFHWKAISHQVGSDQDNAIDTKSPMAASAWGKHDETEWIGTLRVSKTGQSVVVIIKETPSTTLFRCLQAPDGLDVRSFLWGYFQLDEPLVPLYQHWSQHCARLGRIAKCIPGVRIVNQDPWECLASFICSSNNNIPRITKILSAMRREYGVPLLLAGEYDGFQLDETIYSFPSLKELRDKATDRDLRQKCGIGYRAKYILETMELLESLGGEDYLDELKNGSSSGKLSPLEVQASLVKFSGVGRKVADCVALFSLKQSGAIPVDVHVWNIACRDYDEDGELRNVKILTPTIYGRVGDLFRSRFPKKAGWAHSLLFVAELPSFRPVLPKDIVEEMDKFRTEEQARKKRTKK